MCYYPLLDLLECLTASPFSPWSFCTPPPIKDREQKKFLYPTEQMKKQAQPEQDKISKSSVLKSQQCPAFNLYCRQHSAAVGRVSPDLQDTPTLIITVNVQCITSLSCGWDSPILSIPLVPAPAQQSGDLLAVLSSLWPSQRRCYRDQ